MFTHATPASPTLATTTSSAQPSSPVRQSRLRGLSYLRNYTHNLHSSHSRDHSASNTSANATATAPANPATTASAARRLSLSRTTSYPGAGSNPPQVQTATVPAYESLMAAQVAPVTQAIAQSERVQAAQVPVSPAAMVPPNIVNGVNSWLAGRESRRTSGLPSVTGATNGAQAASAQPATAAAGSGTDSPPLRARPAAVFGSSSILREAVADLHVNATNNLTVVNNPSPPPPHDFRPTIRFSQHLDPRAPRPSLMFTPMGRTLPTGTETIKVGRYSERETAPNQPANMSTAAPVGFKSKVVSRRHCEFWVESGQWFIKDVKSSSGTFLNHVRLSPPNTESKPYPVKDGDIVQLGIDFKGGEEMIFRCVKIRVEINRGWQAGLNQFNVASHQRLKKMTKAGGEGTSSSDCSICLSGVAPCQALFVAPCSHTWHYKCIRPVLDGPHFPHFTCPNCRAIADLDADVDEPTEGEWEELDLALEQSQAVAATTSSPAPVAPATPAPAPAPVAEEERAQASTVAAIPPPVPEVEHQIQVPSANDLANRAASIIAALNISTPPSRERERSTSSSRLNLASVSSPNMRPENARLTTPIAISDRRSGEARRGRESESPEGRPHDPVDNPMTPRNDVGPFVFDGSAFNRGEEGGRGTGGENGRNPFLSPEVARRERSGERGRGRVMSEAGTEVGDGQERTE